MQAARANKKAKESKLKDRLRIQELKKTALDAPPQKNTNVWIYILKEVHEERAARSENGYGPDVAHAASARYKQLTPEQREVLSTS